MCLHLDLHIPYPVCIRSWVIELKVKGFTLYLVLLEVALGPKKTIENYVSTWFEGWNQTEITCFTDF